MAAPPRRILVVDDEPAFTETLRDCLIRDGYDVDVALNGRDAVAQFERKRPDAVLLEIVMLPGMDGVEPEGRCPRWGIRKSREDFGQILGVWGAGPGPYVVVPFLEPLTVRDGIGKFVDLWMTRWRTSSGRSCGRGSG